MRIAVSCEMEYLGNPQMQRAYCNMDYIDYVKLAGYSPFIVCPGMDVQSVMEGTDGLLLTGGKDISPLLIGEDLEWNGAKKCNLVRDYFERDLYNAFLEAGKPIFGICRGFQLIVLFTAGRRFSFIQDINKYKDVTLMHQQGDVDITGDNPVHLIECRGVLEKLAGKTLAVNSFHHQGFMMKNNTHDSSWIRQCERIFCWARSRETGFILEAFGINETNSSGESVRVAGVQYHPERMMRGQVDIDHHLDLFRYTMGTLDIDWVRPESPKVVNRTPTSQASALTDHLRVY